MLSLQAVDIKARFITTSDGLSNNSVRNIFQDSHGFIWFATMNGLNRYDGRNFKLIQPENDGRISLADNRVYSLDEDKHGFLWVRTSPNTVSCYDLRNDRFVDFTGSGGYKTHYRELSHIGNDTWLWGEEGCLRASYRNGHFTSEAFSRANGQLCNSEIRRIVRCGGLIWILPKHGLYAWSGGRLTQVSRSGSFMWAAQVCGKTCFITTDGSVYTFNGHLTKIGTIPGISSGYDIPGQITIGHRWFLFTSSGGFVLDTRTNRIDRTTGELNLPRAEVIIDNRGDYWLQDNSGILRYVNRSTGAVKTFRMIDKSRVPSLQHERYKVVHARNGIIWITTSGNGLFAYDTHDGQLQHFMADNSRAAVIPSNSQLCITEDRSGNIWVGTWLYGAAQLTVTGSKACTAPLRNGTQAITGNVRLVRTESSGVWIGNTSGTLFRTDPDVKHVISSFNEGSNIYSVARDATGKLWAGSRTRGLRIGEKWYSHDKNDASSLAADAVFDILRDRRGRMWIATFGGGLCLAVPDGKGGYTFRTFLTETYGMRNMRCLNLDRNGRVWAGTSEGLVVFNPESLIRNPKAYNSYSWNNRKLNGNEIRSIYADRSGRVWIAETGCGFAVCKPGGDYSKLQFTHYGTGSGLVNGMVQAFAEDRQGRIWITTEYGLSCFNPVSKLFRNFFFSPTMDGNIYSENSAATLNDGRLLLGTNNGAVIIDPVMIQNTDREAVVTFTSLTVNGSPLTPEEAGRALKAALPYATEVILRHDRNSFVIHFSTLDFNATSQTLYSYRLEGYEKDWSSPSPLDFASYKNLSPGTYYLHVRATDADGMWSKKESVIKITITPPLWATPLAYLIYVLIIIGTAVLAVRTLRKMDALRTRVKVEEQLTDYKLVFFTNISHEFRTPLTLIQAAMERLQRAGNNGSERTAATELMNKSVKRMLRLINELLEFRKAEKGKLTLSLENTDIIALLKGYAETFKDAAAGRNMIYSFRPEVPSYVMPVDREKLDKIVYNLLSNAFKYTPAGGRVTLTASVDREKGRFLISVRDNGVGIPRSRRDRIFTRFASGNASRNSIGIGLHLVHELVSVHKGTITYNENQGGGSVFTVSLPSDGRPYTPADYLSQDSVLLDNVQNTAAGNLKAEAVKPETGFTQNSASNDDDGADITPMNERTILVIEDDDDVRSLLVSELSAYFTVVARPDGTSGYDYARGNDVDLILCDVMMPGMDGFEVTRRLKEDFDTSHIPVILLTALSADDSKLKGAKCGADAYITKPFSTRVLIMCVCKTIEQREKLKEKFSNDLTSVRPLISTTEGDKQFADRLTAVVTENLSNPDFTVNDFEQAMSLGHTILYRKVKGVTGYAPKEYLRIMRMKKAAELLLKPETNVSEVAYAVGMSDPLYFSKSFKRQFGVSPTAYKKSGGAVAEQPENAVEETE